MASGPISVAFVGTGESTEANVKALLSDWLAEDGDYDPPIIPDPIRKAHKGLMEVWNWLDKEFGKGNVEHLALDKIVPELVKASDKGVAPYLVYIPRDEDDPHLEVVRDALAAGIPVLDMTAGLDEYQVPEVKDSGETGPNGEKIPEKTTARRTTRGAPRTETQPTLPDDTPPWEDGSESDSKASFTEDARSSKVFPGSEPAASSASSSGGMAVVLSQATIEAVLQAFALMAADIKASIVDELPASARPKVTTYPAWYHEEDGKYRLIGGRAGRPRAGERRIELTADEAKAAGLDIP